MGSLEEKLARRVKWKRLNFLTQFKTDFLLLFTGYRKLLGKMPERGYLIRINFNFVRIKLNLLV